ncbi:hypothetical protein [Streptomyces sp. NPDC050428]|uniref:hypothetical protein n=1 Tax=Streptomyces sp. NPDC050428 TaxID=3155757 RepID=UPI003413E327
MILTSDGVHDQLPHAELQALVREDQDDPAALADATIDAVRPKPSGYRDDATVIVLTTA